MKKFLIIQTAFIGDVILATAVAEKLHRFYPNSAIDFLVRKGNESLLNGHPFLHKVLIWDKKNSKYSNLFRLLKNIRNAKYHHVINLQRYAASGLITAFSKADERIGFDKNPLSFLFDKKIEHRIGNKKEQQEQEVKRCLNLINHLTDNSLELPKLYPSISDFAAIQKYIEEDFVTISPASVWFTKQTPISVWIKYIKSQTEKKFYLLGGANDLSICNEICKQCPEANIEILAGKLSLLQSAALMKYSTMNFTNDSAPLHLCSAMNAPVTVVFCSTIPEFGFGPLSANATIVETKVPLQCRPCGVHGFKACPQGHFKCADVSINTLS